jgi:hypothetical protein
VSSVACLGCAFHLLEKLDEAGESLFTGRLVAGDSVIGIFAGTHEAVPGTIVGNGFVSLASGLHGGSGGWYGGADAGVVAGVEAVNGTGDGVNVRGTRAVEHEGGGKVFAVGGEGERLTPTPAKADRSDFAVGGRKALSILGCRIQVGGNDIRI